jgi:hypothetical protein
LVSDVAAFVAEGLGSGEGAVVIATPAHARGIEEALSVRGVDASFRKEGRLVFVDAEETLGRFVVAGSPDAERFEACIEPVLESARGPSGVRAYGEMVACLWRDGNLAGALALEEFWSRLAERVALTLYCSYPSELVDGVHNASQFEATCRLHSDVVAESRLQNQSSEREMFSPEAGSVPRARSFVAEVLAKMGRPDLAGVAALVVSELASNAVAHTRTPFAVTVSPLGAGVRVSVRDGSASMPTRKTSGSADLSGRGLLIVEGTSHSWGVTPNRKGKVVWAELRSRG